MIADLTEGPERVSEEGGHHERMSRSAWREREREREIERERGREREKERERDHRREGYLTRVGKGTRKERR